MGKRVLTVDDSKTLRIIVAKHLKPFGVEILEAENGSIGLAKAQADKPDLILLDYNMPVMDGLQTLEALKKDPATKMIPVIMLTTETVRETVVKLIKIGLKDYIAKPFSREALLTKVNPVLALFEGDIVPEVHPDGALQAKASDGAGKKTVLVVDDKENVHTLLKDFLGAAGFGVKTAASGKEAVAMIPLTAFDLLLLDLDMPDLGGIEVYRQTRSVLDAKRAKIVGMALRTAQAEINNAKLAGIQEFLYKPFTRPDVNALVANFENFSAAGANRRFLRAQGDVRLLSFPQENDPDLKNFANALGNEIRKELNDMAEEGMNKLVILLTPAVSSDFAMIKKFIALLEMVSGLSLSVRLVAENEGTMEKLRQFSETAKMQTLGSLDLALKSFA